MRLDVGAAYVAYRAKPEARPDLWGSKSAIELTSLRVQFQAGLRPAFFAGFAYGMDARAKDSSAGQSHNFLENEFSAGLGWTLSPSDVLEFVPNMKVLLAYRSLKGAENASVAMIEPGLTARLRLGARIALSADIGYRAGSGAPDSLGGDALVGGSGPRIGGGMSFAF
jgi:hypothetical protein